MQHGLHPPRRGHRSHRPGPPDHPTTTLRHRPSRRNHGTTHRRQPPSLSHRPTNRRRRRHPRHPLRRPRNHGRPAGQSRQRLTVRALLMPVGPDWYAIATESVREVVARPMLTAVPTGPDALVGLFNLRGEIVPLFDTAALLGIGHGRCPARSARSCSLTLGRRRPGRHGRPGGCGDRRSLRDRDAGRNRTCSIGGRVATLIDVELLLAPDRLGWLSR